MTPAALVAILIAVESRGNPAAIGDTHRRDGQFARGVLQVREPMRDEYFRLTGRYVSDLSLWDSATQREMATVLLTEQARRLRRELSVREASAYWQTGAI